MGEPTSYRQELKERIVESASALFHKKGIRSVKMDDIAGKLSISKRTLYEIYDNKEDLLYEVVARHHRREEEYAAHLERKADSVMDVLIGITRSHMQQFSEINPLFLRELGRYPRVSAYLSQLREHRRAESKQFIERGIREGYFLPFVNYDLLAILADNVMNNAIMDECGGFDMQELFHTSTIMFVRSICTRKGLRIFDSFLSEMKGERT